MASFTQTIHASANGISLIEAAEYAAEAKILEMRGKVRGTAGRVTFMFDDGFASAYTAAKPIFDAASAVACVAIITDEIGETGRMSAAQLVELEGDGWEICSHCKTTALLTSLSEADLRATLTESKAALEALGLTVNNLVYPGHAQNALIRSVTREYYRAARGADAYGVNPKVLDSYKLLSVLADPGEYTEAQLNAYADVALADGRWVIFYWHDVTAEVQTRITNLVAYVQGIGLDIVTMNDALDEIGNVIECGDRFAASDNGVRIVTTGTQEISEDALNGTGLYWSVTETQNSGRAKFGVLKAKDGTYSLPGIWMNQATPSFTNYCLQADAAGTYFNAPTGYVLDFRINNATKVRCDTNGNLLVGTTTGPTASGTKVVVVGNNAATPTFAADTGGFWLNANVLTLYDSTTGAKTLGTLAAAGTTAVGTHESTYNHANYDTAYGWGDHEGLYQPINTVDVVNDTTPQLGGDLDANGKAIHFGSAAANIHTPSGANPSLTINLANSAGSGSGAHNHHKINLTSASGTLALTLDAPVGFSAGVVFFKQHATTPVDVTIAAASPHTVQWQGTEPDWGSDAATKWRGFSWFYDPDDDVICLSATETN